MAHEEVDRLFVVSDVRTKIHQASMEDAVKTVDRLEVDLEAGKEAMAHLEVDLVAESEASKM